MHFQIDRQSLLFLLSHAQPIVESRNTIPILSNILLKANDGFLTVEATDLDIMTHERIAADIKRPGSTTMSAKLLYDIARKMPDGSLVDIDVSATQATIRAGRAKFTLPVLSPDVFPQIQTDKWETTFEIKTDEIRRILHQVRYAISNDGTRYYLQGVFMHIAPNELGCPELRAVATDGHRLALQATEAPLGNDTIPDVIIPKKCVQEVAKNLDDSGETIKISLSTSKVQFVLGELTITSKLIDGRFPDYTRVIPTGNKFSLIVSAKQMAEGIDRVSTISSEKTRAVRLELHPDRVELSTRSSDVGQGMETVLASYSGAPLVVGFNSAYLKDMLAQHGDHDVEMTFQDESSPSIIRSIGSKTALGVCMPLRI